MTSRRQPVENPTFSLSNKKKESADKIENPTIPMSGFFAAAAVVVLGGVLGGIKLTLRREKETLGGHKSSTPMALRAFGFGTILCFGTFGLATAGFVMTTGISNIEEFVVETKKALKVFDVSYSDRDITSPEFIQENKEAEAMVNSLNDWLDPSNEDVAKDGNTAMSELAQSSKYARPNVAIKEKRVSPVLEWFGNLGSGKPLPVSTEKRESPIMQLFKKKDKRIVDKQPELVVDAVILEKQDATVGEKTSSTTDVTNTPTITTTNTNTNADTNTEPTSTTYSYFVTMLFGKPQVVPVEEGTPDSEKKIER